MRGRVELARVGRHRRHWWTGHGRAQIEVRALRRAGSEALARDVKRALAGLKGVRWAEVNAVVGRVAVSFDEGTLDVSRLLSAVDAVERSHGFQDDTFGFDRPELPGDDEPLERAALVLISDLFGIAAGTIGGILRLPGLSEELAGLISLIDSQPRLRRPLTALLGPQLTDVGLAITNAVGQGLAQGPFGLVVDAAHRSGLLKEAMARRASWERLEANFDAPLPATYRAPLKRSQRPVPLPDGPLEQVTDALGLASLLAGLAALASTRSARRAASVLIAGTPKAARLGRESFAQRLAIALSESDELVLNPNGLRRLDLVDTVLVDAAALQGLQCGEATEKQNDAAAAEGPEGGEVTENQLAENDGVVPGGWRALLNAARRAGHMVALAGEDLALSKRLGADLLVEGGAALASSVRSLQRDGCAVLLVSCMAPEALAAADCGVGFCTGACPPWGADVVAKDLGTVTFLVEATIAARSTCKQSAGLAAAGTATGAVLGLAVPAPLAASRALTSVNAAAFTSLVNGWRQASSLARRPRPALEEPPWHQLGTEEVMARLGTSLEGLTSDQVRERMHRATRTAKGPDGGLAQFAGAVVEELANPLTPVLAGGAVLSSAVGSGSDAAMVGAVAGLNALIGGTLRYRAEAAVRSLDRRSQQQVTVLRNRSAQKIPAESLLVGDIVVLHAGDAVPADCRILEAVALEVDESSLTGESLPVGKSQAASPGANVPERSSMLYAETSVVAGQAKAVVVALDEKTEAAAGDPAFRKPVAAGAQARLRHLTALSVPLAALGGATVAGSALLRGRSLSEPLSSAVNLAVAAVPEGLPLVATMAQLAAAQRLSQRGALVRNPAALEALARVNVLCTDKTGTLTDGRVLLTSVHDGHRLYPLDRPSPRSKSVIAAALRATPDGKSARLDMTDNAVTEAAERCGVTTDLGAPEWQPQAELPFEPSRGFHARGGRSGEQNVLSVKGSPEVLLSRCAHWRNANDDRPVTQAWRARLGSTVETLAGQGLRLLAVAERTDSGGTTAQSEKRRPGKGRSAQGGPEHGRLEEGDVRDLTFVGLLALADPVRPSAAQAVEGLKAAGVQVVMVTGDHPSTAESVAAEVGLLNGHRAVTGADLAAMSDEELDKVLPEICVFARVTPADKMRIVSAYQRAGRSVAMTGDGSNDAAAIRLADAGLALGRRATTAARSAADIVITDDRIETVLDAITEGRAMWASVKQAVSVLVGGNAGEVLFSAGASLVFGRPPLSARQLLLVNLMTDVAPSIAIAVQRPPTRSPEQLRNEGPESSLGASLYLTIAERALVTGAGAGAAWSLARLTGRRQRASTVALVGLVGSQLGQTLLAGHGNPWVIAAGVGSAALLAGVVQTPGVSQFFGCTPLGPVGWAIGLGSSAAATAASALISGAHQRLPHLLKG